MGKYVHPTKKHRQDKQSAAEVAAGREAGTMGAMGEPVVPEVATSMEQIGQLEDFSGTTEIISGYRLISVRPLGVGVPMGIKVGSALDSILDTDMRAVTAMAMRGSDVVLTLADGKLFRISGAAVVTEFVKVDALLRTPEEEGTA